MSFDFVILRFYAYFFLNLYLIYNFSFFQRLEVDVKWHVYIHSYFLLWTVISLAPSQL